MITRHTIDYEHLPDDGPLDETDVNLRAYLARLPDGHLSRYDPLGTDEQVREWDGERAVDVEEFRRVLAKHLRYRELARS